MFTRKFSITAAVGLAALLSTSTASAMDENFNAKEINGRSDYFSVTSANSDLADISFTESGQGDNNLNTLASAEKRAGKTAAFDDADGVLGALGHDYGYVRLETEFGLRETSVSGLTGEANRVYTGVQSSIHLGSAMVNLAFEYSVDPGELAGSGPSGFSITPYITGGGGVLGAHGNFQFTTADTELDKTDEAFFIAPALQGGAGLTVGVPFGVELFAQYSEMIGFTHYFKASDDIYIKTVSGGLRVNF